MKNSKNKSNRENYKSESLKPALIVHSIVFGLIFVLATILLFSSFISGDIQPKLCSIFMYAFTPIFFVFLASFKLRDYKYSASIKVLSILLVLVTFGIAVYVSSNLVYGTLYFYSFIDFLFECLFSFSSVGSLIEHIFTDLGSFYYFYLILELFYFLGYFLLCREATSSKYYILTLFFVPIIAFILFISIVILIILIFVFIFIIAGIGNSSSSSSKTKYKVNDEGHDRELSQGGFDAKGEYYSDDVGQKWRTNDNCDHFYKDDD